MLSEQELMIQLGTTKYKEILLETLGKKEDKAQCF